MPQQVVTGPDGKRFVFPDGMPKEQITAILREEYGTQKSGETPVQYLQRLEAERAAKEEARRNTEAQATQAYQRGRSETAERMGLDNPLMAAFGAQAMDLGGRGQAREVYRAEGIVPPDEAAGLHALNSAGLWIPGMANKQFGADLEEARRQEPGAALVGDIAGSYLPAELAGNMIMGGVSRLGAMFKGKPPAPAAQAAPEVNPDAELLDRIRVSVERRAAAKRKDEENLAKAMEMFEPYATPREREMLGLPPKPAPEPAPAAPQPRPKGAFGREYRSIFEEIDYVLNSGARAEGLDMNEFRELMKRYPKDKLRAYIERVRPPLPDGLRMTDDEIMSAAEMAFQQSHKRGIKAQGFMPRGEVAQRGSGFLDDLERGAERFYDERLGPEGSNWNKAVEMARNGYTNDEIADALDLSSGTVKVRLSQARAMGIDVPKAYKPGGATRTETGTRQDILKLKEQGLTVEQIAERTGKPRKGVVVMLSAERKRLRDAGEDVPGWLAQERAFGGTGGDIAEDLFALGIGTGALSMVSGAQKLGSMMREDH